MKVVRPAALVLGAALVLTPHLAAAAGPGPSAALGSAAAVDGTRLGISGSGFSATTTLTVRFSADVLAGGKGGMCQDEPDQRCRFLVATNASGDFDTSIVVPLGLSGPVDVDVQDHVAHTTTDVGQFKATRVPLRLHLSNTRPRAGSTMTITGGGGYPGDSLRLLVNSRVLAYLKASATGRFSYSYRLSTGAQGSNLIRLQDSHIHQFAAVQFIVP